MDDVTSAKKRMENKSHLLSGMQRFVIILICICMIPAALSAFYREREIHKGAVMPEMLSYETKNYEAAKYKLTKNKEITKDGNIHYNVTVGNVSFVMSVDDYSQYFDDTATALDTSIYVLTITNTESYPLSYFGKNTITIVRLSCLGEQEFSEEEIEVYKRDVCPILTLSKRNQLLFKNEQNAADLLWNKTQLTWK